MYTKINLTSFRISEGDQQTKQKSNLIDIVHLYHGILNYQYASHSFYSIKHRLWLPLLSW